MVTDECVREVGVNSVPEAVKDVEEAATAAVVEGLLVGVPVVVVGEVEVDADVWSFKTE